MTVTIELPPDIEAGLLAQAQAEGLVEDHKQGLLKSIEELYRLTEQQSELRGLQSELTRTQQRIEAIRAQHPDLKLLSE